MTSTSLIVSKAAASAFRGGTAGAVAMVLQVVLLMWLRTVINFQYRHGDMTIPQAFQTLYKQGGIARFYQGAQYALLQGPLSRFGDTAANEGVKELLRDSGLSMGLVTACASFAAALWRIVLTPVDTLKTTLQVSGEEGMLLLREKISKNGLLSLYDGALGNWGANIVGHYPWFVVNNQLESLIPPAGTPGRKLVRRAFIGFCSSVVSDCCSNGIRVLKTYKQTSSESLSYIEALNALIAESGVAGFLFRGLGMKLVSNALSSILFSVLWKILMDRIEQRQEQGSHTVKKRTSKPDEDINEWENEATVEPLLSPSIRSQSSEGAGELSEVESSEHTRRRTGMKR